MSFSISRLRKLSEGAAEMQIQRAKNRGNVAKAMPVQGVKITKILTSPYSNKKMNSRTPSYALIQPARTSNIKKSNSNSSIRVIGRESKVSPQNESVSSRQHLNNPWETMKIQAKLLKSKLKSLESTGHSNDPYKHFQEFFKEIIEKDILFGKILKKVQDAYDEYINKLNSECASLRSITENLSEEKKSYLRLLDKISRENIGLGDEVSKLENMCKELEQVLDEIKNVKLEGIPRDENKWKALLYENSQYNDLIYNMKLDIKDFQYKEDRLIKLVDAMKKRGMPVDEVYEEDVKSVTFLDSEYFSSPNSSSYKRIPLLEISKVFRSTDSLNL